MGVPLLQVPGIFVDKNHRLDHPKKEGFDFV